MANDLEKRITARMILDSTGFNDSLKGVNSNLKGAQSELKLASSGMQAFGKDSEKLKSVQEALSKQVELHAQKVNIYKESIEKSTNKLQENIKERDKLKESLDNANKKYEEAVKLYGKESTEAQKAKEDVSNLEKEYKNKEKAVESNAKQINNYTTNLNKANAEMTKAQGELNKVSKELKEQDSKWLSASKALKDHSENLKNVGRGISETGDKLLKLSAPLVGVGVVAAKVAMDFDSQMSRVRAISNATGEEFEKLNKQALQLGADTAFSAKEAALGMENLASAGFSVNEIVAAMPGMLDLAASSGEDVGISADIAASTLRGFNIAAGQAGHVADVLAKNAADTNAAVKDTGEAMKYVAPVASAMGRSLEEVTAAIGIMANAGIKGSQAGTTLRGALSRLADPSKEAAGAMKEIGFQAFDGQGKLLTFKDLIGNLQKSTEGLTDKQKQQAISTIFGQEAMSGMLTLIKAGPEEFDKLTKSLKNSDGAAKDMASTMQDNAKSSVEQMMGSIETAGIKLGQSLAPTIIKVADSVGKLADKFANLSPETQETIIKTTALTFGLGGLLKVGGGVIGSIGNIAGGLSKLSGALGAAKIATEGVGAAAGVAGGAGGVGALTGALGAIAPIALPAIGIIGGVGLAAYGIHKTLSQEVVPSVDLFANKVQSTSLTMGEFGNKTSGAMQKTVVSISEGTKKAVGAYMELDSKAKQHIDSLYINSVTITEELKNATIAKFSEMNTKIVEGYRTQKEAAILETTEMFTNTKSITEIEQKELLTSIDQYYKDQETTVNNANNQIKIILDRASNEHRQLTKEEYEMIATWKDKMKEKAVTALSENEIEAKVILERMKEYDGRITAEQASEHVTKLNESRDKAVATANDEYEKRIALIEKMRSEGVIKSKDQADKMIAEAKRQRDGIVENADKTRMDAIEKMRKMNKDLETQVDTSTGKILTWWDKLKRWWTGWKPESKNFEYQITARQDQSTSIIPDEHWTGTNYYKGGLTTLHERGYEVYDLPRSTRIYNHEASEDLVLKTAESVASKVAEGMLNRSSGANGVNVIQNIYSPAPSPAEIARQSKNSLRELGYF